MYTLNSNSFPHINLFKSLFLIYVQVNFNLILLFILLFYIGEI